MVNWLLCKSQRPIVSDPHLGVTSDSYIRVWVNPFQTPITESRVVSFERSAGLLFESQLTPFLLCVKAIEIIFYGWRVLWCAEIMPDKKENLSSQIYFYCFLRHVHTRQVFFTQSVDFLLQISENFPTRKKKLLPDFIFYFFPISDEAKIILSGSVIRRI